MNKKLGFVLVSVFLVGCVSGKPYYYNNPSVTYPQYETDREECLEIAKNTKDNTYVYNDGTVGGAIGSGIAKGIAEAEALVQNHKNCMVVRGYKIQEMTGEERKEFKKLSKDERKARVEELLLEDLPVLNSDADQEASTP